MEAKNNMKQAMYEMFGVGSDQVNDTALANDGFDGKNTAESVLAAGTSFEGKLYSDGNVEILGVFKGNITAKGKVRVCNVCEGDITAGSLEIFGGEINGDVTAVDTIVIGSGTRLCGNITAKELVCAGAIVGNLNVSKGAVIEATAKVEGDITADTVSIAKGAFIRGGLQIKASAAPVSIVAPVKPVEKETV